MIQSLEVELPIFPPVTVVPGLELMPVPLVFFMFHLRKQLTSVVGMGGVFAKYSVQAVAWLFSKKSGLFFGISRFKKIDTVS